MCKRSMGKRQTPREGKNGKLMIEERTTRTGIGVPCAHEVPDGTRRIKGRVCVKEGEALRKACGPSPPGAEFPKRSRSVRRPFPAGYGAYSSLNPKLAMTAVLSRQFSLTFTQRSRKTLMPKNRSMSSRARVPIFLSISPFLPMIIGL